MYEPYPLAPHLEAFTSLCVAKCEGRDQSIIAALEQRLDELEAAHDSLNRITGKETRYERAA